MKWMIGRSIAEVEKMDYTWFFRFDDGTVIATENCWRLVVATGIAVTSEDHGHQFGLATPLDAANVVKTKTNGKTINHAELDKNTGDLTLSMESTFLTFLCLSSGYEAWRITHGDLEFVCMGGGRVEQISRGKTSEQVN
ncbi:MAG TPA: DUF6188 family protein [Thermodesulfobacteriota bacterium]|nr:DUF6188 family protein [Thermodesulfobacteriota bacterium]